MINYTVMTGDCRESLDTLEPNSVDCCVTSLLFWST